MTTPLDAAVIAQHALVAAMIVVLPVLDRIATRDLKTSADPGVKRRYYLITLALLWFLAVVSIAAVGGYAPLARVGWSAADARWAPIMVHVGPFVRGAVIGMMIVLILPAAMVLWNAKARARAGRALESLSFFLPATPTERAWWVILSVTAGVCEEIVFRGFLLRYLHTTPWQVTLPWAIVISSAIFGLQHLYQGVNGVVQTALVGVLFCTVFLVTGSLVVPMLLHTVMDLRVLLLIPPAPETPTTN
jgi:membrane protease YdiL (CAAX protease family)